LRPLSTRTRNVRRSLLLRCLTALLLIGIAIGSAPTVATARSPIISAQAAPNLVDNWSFEEGFEGESADQKVAKEWDSFVLSGEVQFWSGYNLYGASCERIDGETSQVLKSDEAFDAGIYQIISGLKPNQWYSALVFVLSIFQTSAVDDPTIFDGKIIKQIGVDPYGGRSPTSPDIIWGPPIDKNMDRNTWGERVTFQAQETTATLFIRIRSLETIPEQYQPYYDNLVFIDGAQVRRAPIAQAVVPEETQTEAFTVSWDGVIPEVPSERYAKVIEYDVQYRDGVGEWQDWLQHTTSSQQTFDLGNPGHVYTFRVRAWARYYDPFAEIFGPWAESAPVQIGRVAELAVTDNLGNAVMGVRAQLLDPQSQALVASATTDFYGLAYLAPPTEGEYDLTVSPAWYLDPPPVHGVTIGPGVEPVAITLRPPDDVVEDGSFEADEPRTPPDEWPVIGTGAEISQRQAHTGTNSLRFSASNVCVRRHFTLNQAYRPVFSLWYRIDPGVQGMQKLFVLRLFDSDLQEIKSVGVQSQTDTGWQPLHISVTPDASEPVYDGTVTVELCLEDDLYHPSTEETDVYLDDIALGSSSGGPHKVSLPVIAVSLE